MQKMWKMSSKTLCQVAGGWAFSGNECTLCDAFEQSKHGGQNQPGWFTKL